MSAENRDKWTPEFTQIYDNCVKNPNSRLKPEILLQYERLQYIDVRKMHVSGKFRSKGRNHWEDKQMLGLKFVQVSSFNSLDQASKARILEAGLSSLTKQVSEFSIGALLAGAWGLISCENFNRPCFTKFPNMLTEGVNLNNLQTHVSKQGNQSGEIRFVGTDRNSWSRFERSATYMCAAVLRLVVKNEANLLNAWEYLMNRYQLFYCEEIAFRISLSRDCVTEVRSLLQHRIVLKETVAVFLLAFQDLHEGNDKQMCRILFESQIRFTGMHAYNLMLICSAKLEAPMFEFIRLLEHPGSKDALETAAELLKTYEFPENEDARARANKAKTWRYARVYDSDVFATLQPKSCESLTALLACLAQKLGLGSSGDFTKIKAIESCMANQKDWLEEKAQRIISHSISAGWDDPHKVKFRYAAASSSGHSG